jgi:serine/threonine protein kinase
MADQVRPSRHDIIDTLTSSAGALGNVVLELFAPAPAHGDASTLARAVSIRNFHIGDKIGKGSFGSVYAARNTVTGQPLAIKVELLTGEHEASQLEVEWRTYSHLTGCAGVLQVVAYYTSPPAVAPPLRMMAMQLAPLCLDKAVYCIGAHQRSGPEFTTASAHPTHWPRHLSVGATAWVGRAMVRALQHMHVKGVIHRDIKPQNVAVVDTPSGPALALFDLGLAKCIVHDGQHIAHETGCAFLGTVLYASPLVHAGHRASRRDDLWSAGVMACACGGAALPWMCLGKSRGATMGASKRSARKRRMGIQASMKRDRASWGVTLSPSWCEYFDIVDGLKFDEEPPYAHLAALFDAGASAPHEMQTCLEMCAAPL